jgi:hypothetical protein
LDCVAEIVGTLGTPTRNSESMFANLVAQDKEDEHWHLIGVLVLIDPNFELKLRLTLMYDAMNL